MKSHVSDRGAESYIYNIYIFTWYVHIVYKHVYIDSYLWCKSSKGI